MHSSTTLYRITVQYTGIYVCCNTYFFSIIQKYMNVHMYNVINKIQGCLV